MSEAPITINLNVEAGPAPGEVVVVRLPASATVEHAAAIAEIWREHEHLTNARAIILSADVELESGVLVPSDLARRIRLALDHAHRDNANLGHLADELIACEGYPLKKEPWSD